MPRSNLNVDAAAVGAFVVGTGVAKRVFVAVGTFGVDCCELNGCVAVGVALFAAVIVGFVVTPVAEPAAGFSVGVLLVAVGVNSNGIFPDAAGVRAGTGATDAVVLSFATDDFAKFNVFSDDLDCDINENEGDFCTLPPNENEGAAAAPNILGASVLVPPNENGLDVVVVTAVAAGASNEGALLLGALVSLADFSTVPAPNPKEICGLSVFPKNDFDAPAFIDGDGPAGVLVVVIVHCFSTPSFALDVVVVVLTTCCGRIDCVG